MGLFFAFFVISNSASCQIDELMAEGDSLYSIFDNQGALSRYMEVHRLSPDNVEALWKISRAHVDIGEHHQPKSEQEGYFRKALIYADSAVILAPENAEAHTRRAIALGKIALFKGVFKSISLVKQVKESLERALEINPNLAVAHYIMGRTHSKICEKPKIARKLLGLGWADLDIGLEEYRKAIEIDSTFIMYRLDYARLLIRAGNMKEAEKQLLIIRDLPTRDEDDHLCRETADVMLKKLGR